MKGALVASARMATFSAKSGSSPCLGGSKRRFRPSVQKVSFALCGVYKDGHFFGQVWVEPLFGRVQEGDSGPLSKKCHFHHVASSRMGLFRPSLGRAPFWEGQKGDSNLLSNKYHFIMWLLQGWALFRPILGRDPFGASPRGDSDLLSKSITLVML